MPLLCHNFWDNRRSQEQPGSRGSGGHSVDLDPAFPDPEVYTFTCLNLLL